MSPGVLIVFFLVSCGSREHASNSTRSDESDARQSAPTSFNATDRIIPYGPAPEFEFSKVVRVGDLDAEIDFNQFRVNLTALANDARKAESDKTGQVCACGCSVLSNLRLLPAVTDLYSPNDNLDTFQIIRSCDKRDDGSVLCNSGPDSWTKRGWEEFAVDLIGRLNTRGIDVLSTEKKSVDISKIVAFLKQEKN